MFVLTISALVLFALWYWQPLLAPWLDRVPTQWILAAAILIGIYAAFRIYKRIRAAIRDLSD